MTEQQLRGRRKLWFFIASLIALQLSLLVLYRSTLGIERLSILMTRFALSCILLSLVYSGSEMAKGISIFLLGITGLAAGITLTQSTDTLSLVSLGVAASLCLSFAAVLIKSSEVNSFLDYQSKVREVPRRKTQAVGEVFKWPKGTILKPLDRLVLALPKSMLDPEESIEDVMRCAEEPEISIPDMDDKIFVRLNSGVSIWLIKPTQAMVLPWDGDEADPKKLEFRPSLESPF